MPTQLSCSTSIAVTLLSLIGTLVSDIARQLCYEMTAGYDRVTFRPSTNSKSGLELTKLP